MFGRIGEGLGVKGGRGGTRKFFVGEVMRETRGRASPGVLNPLVGECLGELEKDWV